MKRNFKSIAVAAAIVCLCVPTVAVAATHFLSARATAEYLGSKELSALFADSDVLATCEDGDYRFVYLGNASATLKDMFLSEEDTAATYIALAVERLDGTPIGEEEGFVASPLIQGLDPVAYNIYSMGGGATWDEKDGIRYMIMNVDSIEMFADRTVYLAITTGPDYKNGYLYDSETGRIEANDEFEGINALFEIQLDAGKSDVAAQKTFVDTLAQKNGNISNGTVSMESTDLILSEDEVFNTFCGYHYEELDALAVHRIKEEGTCIDSYEFTADENGNYQIQIENEYVSAEGSLSQQLFEVDRPSLEVYHFDEEAGFVILEYNCRDEKDVLHQQHIKYDRTQMQNVIEKLSIR